MSLERFHEAQADPRAGYELALAEIRHGRKSSHWIWYIFPQLAGLGHSSAARYYGIRDLEEARDFLCDQVLSERYLEIANAVRDQVARGVNLETLMGSRLDTLKLISSLTLFRAVARAVTREDVAFDDWQLFVTRSLSPPKRMATRRALEQLLRSVKSQRNGVNVCS